MNTRSDTVVWRSLFVILFVLMLPRMSPAVELVRAEIEKASAWTGEAVPLVIKLYSPGPFSGTASFDLPDLPLTAFVQSGRPVVGSEDVDGESYITQRHVLTLYTQRDGEIVIPPFRVRYAGKKTFTSDSEPMEGLTQELRFQSKRPPGTESMELVVTAKEMDIQQTWNPEPTAEFKTGDVIVRTIKRTAVGTTAMMLPAVPESAPDGLQVYTATPEVEDKIDRGDSRALRTDTTKYQFQRGGLVMLPELVFVWWDPQREKVQRQTLPGLTIAVVETSAAVPPASESEPETSPVSMFAIVGLLVLGLIAWLIRKPVFQLIDHWRAHHNRPEALAVRKLRAACKSNDASAAYSALMSWIAIRRADAGDDLESCFQSEQRHELGTQWQMLSRHLFARNPAAPTWQGRQLWDAFSRWRHRPKHRPLSSQTSALPQLNPRAASAGRSVSL